MTTGGTVLVVEHNPGTLKMLRAALESEGHTVLEAPDAHTALSHVAGGGPAIDLIIQDLILPDMAGLDLTRRLRAIPSIADVPILASSGFLNGWKGTQAIAAGYSDLLVKPIEPARLVEAVQAHMPAHGRQHENVGRARRIILADDDPIQLKLVAFHLQNAGFQVTPAADGMEALALARQRAPDAIVSDLLMPRLDGYELCLEVRRDPALSAIPVLLLSSQYLEELDQSLAAKVGANRFLTRTPNPRELVRTLAEILTEDAAQPAAAPVEVVKQEHVHRVVRQLERHVSLSASLAQRCAIQATQLSLLGGVADALAERADVESVLRDVLPGCLDAAGISRAVVYLMDAGSGELTLQHAIGFAEVDSKALASCFGYLPLLRQLVMEGGTPLRLPSPSSAGLPEADGRALLACLGLASAHVIPLGSARDALGVLLTGGDAAEPGSSADSDPVAFVRALGRQIGQAVALARAFADLRRAIVAKDEFFVIASHELRTPLTALGLQVETLQRGLARGFSREQMDDKVTTIARHVGRLGSLIEGLLTVNRMMAGPLALSRETVDLAALVRATVERLPEAAERKRVRIDAPARLTGSWDQAQMQTVVAHLVSNALKFSQDEPVEISVADADGLARLSVTDHGIGFSPEDQARIFQRYERAVPLRNYGGFGVGLWMVQQIVEAHGGHVRVDSREGVGSTFTLELPLSA